MRKKILFGLGVLAIAVLPRASQAQGITITPQIGVYVPGNNIDALRSGADTVLVNREGDLALGFNIDLGIIRGSLAYASGAKLNESGTSGDVGKGKLLAVAGDLVIRPLPRLIVLQPYLLLGGGLRRTNYSFDTDALNNAFPKDESKFAFHGGVGADVMLGPVGISAEITDFLSQNTDKKWKQHDGFGFVGLRLKL